MNLRYLAASTLLAISIVSSCSPQKNSDKEVAFRQLFPLVEMNTRIRFWPASEQFKVGACIDLALENHSSDRVIFPSDYGIQVLSYSEGIWTDIENLTQYYPLAIDRFHQRELIRLVSSTSRYARTYDLRASQLRCES